MDERVQFTPLCGVQDESPLSYLLQIDDTRILLDCGWNHDFDVRLLEPLREVASSIDLILITFADLAHMGALPYALKHFDFGESTWVYMTTPTKMLGLQTLYDAYLAHAVEGPFEVFDLDDVDAIERRIKDRGFEDQIRVTGKSSREILIDAFVAGRMLGGAMWRIRRDPDVILYAVDVNHAKDAHLDGIFSKIDQLKPTLVITDAFNFFSPSREKLNRRRDDLCKKVLATLRRNRNVLLPVDCGGGRMLELLLVLKNFFAKQKLTYPLVLVTSVASVLEFAKTSLEYMNRDVTSEFEKTRRNPFDFSGQVQVVATYEQVQEIRDPKVVLAGLNTLDYGVVKRLLEQYGAQEGHLVMLTDRSMDPDCLTRKLYSHLQTNKTDLLSAANIETKVVKSRWQYKRGQDLVRWRIQQKEQMLAEERRKQQEEEQKALRDDMAMDGMEDLDIFQIIGDSNSKNGIDDAGGDTQDTIGDSEMKDAGPASLTRQSSFGDEAARTGGGLFALFASKDEDATKTMFSAFEPERMKRWDEYGEVINEEDFIPSRDAVEGDEITAGDPSSLLEDDSDDDDIEEDEEDGAAATDTDGDTQMTRKRKHKRNAGNPLEDALLPRESRKRLPRECITEETVLSIRGSIGYVDMEGRANGVDMMNILSLLKPSGLRKVVIVHGSKTSTEAMAEECRKMAIQTVLTPNVGETVDVSSDVGMWRQELDRGLFDLNYALYSDPQVLSGIGVRYIEGVVDSSTTEPASNAASAQVPVVRPISQENDTKLARAVEPQFVCTTLSKYTIFKRLQEFEEDLQPRLNGNLIVCKDAVSVIVEHAGQQVLVQGPVSKTYYKVREVVYSSFITV